MSDVPRTDTRLGIYERGTRTRLRHTALVVAVLSQGKDVPCTFSSRPKNPGTATQTAEELWLEKAKITLAALGLLYPPQATRSPTYAAAGIMNRVVPASIECGPRPRRTRAQRRTAGKTIMRNQERGKQRQAPIPHHRRMGLPPLNYGLIMHCMMHKAETSPLAR